MYDADDILDLCRIMEGGEDPTSSSPAAPKTKSWCWNLFFCFRNPVVAHEIGKKIKALNQRLVEIAERSSRFGFITQAINSSGYPINNSTNPWSDSNTKTGSSIVMSDVVGEKIEEDTKKIVDLLIKKVDAPVGLKGNNVVVDVAITGMGGIGKTTLARMIFGDSRVEENFGERIWLSVNQEFNEISVLQSVLASFGANHDGCAGNKDLLERTLKNMVQQKKKFLLVMDDVWSERVWNELLRVPLGHGASGSRVLVTTRNDGVARGMKAQHLHRVDKLKSDDAWVLLKKQVVMNESDDEDYVDGLKGIGMEIVDKCDCLPLALKVIGGVLRRKSRTRDAWKDAVEDLGTEYYKELVSRNLLEPDKSSYGLSACIMHDVVRSFALYIMKGQGVLLIEGQDANRALSIPKLRLLSIANKAVGLDTLQKQASLRTLMLFGSTTVLLKDLLNKLSCLRVLYIHEADKVEVPDSICRLKHLRYLCLSNTSISTIPRDIGDLKFLHAINLRGCTNISQLPSSIIKLRKLRSLNFRRTSITSVPRGFWELEDLITLMGFPTHSDGSADGWCSLQELGPLLKLQELEISGLEKTPSGSMAAKAMLSSKHHLTGLFLIFTSRLGENGEVQDDISEEEHERIEDVLSNLCPPTCMETLHIIGYFARGLPQWMRTMSAFGSLRWLQLDDYACCTQLPNGLGQLPFLDYFWVKRAPSVRCVGHDFLVPSLGGEAAGCKGEVYVPTETRHSKRQPHHTSHGAGGVVFPKLRKLGFDGMLRWTEWEWEQHVPAMPVLEKIWVQNCKLQCLPAGLAQHACRLRELGLKNIQHLVSVENFPSLVKLRSYDNPRLKRIRNNPSLQWIDISNCPALEELDGLSSLRSLEWWDLDAEALPEYLRDAKLKLRVDCSPKLLKLISLQDDSSEWGKIRHVQQVKVYGKESNEDSVDRHIFYTKEPYSFEAIMDESTDED
ncbi:unnamed protein product [Urochloa decumbens]|uniref:NB-ARC domain-containing protein n=1 Tax=Urochloa decumbens TaxID=240449 RepID=A0ABC8XJC3_9POAL